MTSWSILKLIVIITLLFWYTMKILYIALLEHFFLIFILTIFMIVFLQFFSYRIEVAKEH